MTEDDAVVCAFLKYVARERERTGLGLKKVAKETYRQQEKGYSPQRPGKKGYKPQRKPSKQTTRKTPEKVQKS